MATAAQLAARKLFAARAKAGTLRKNPAKRKKPAAKKTVAKKSISKPSQITKRAPTKRLKARRAANSKPGYFPNPAARKTDHLFVYEVKERKARGEWRGEWTTLAKFATRVSALAYFQAYGELLRRSGRAKEIELGLFP